MCWVCTSMECWEILRRRHRSTCIHYYNLDEWELFDLKQDPREMKSVYYQPEYQEVVSQLKTRVGELQQQYAVPDDRGSVPADPPSMHPQQKPPKKNARSKSKAE